MATSLRPLQLRSVTVTTIMAFLIMPCYWIVRRWVAGDELQVALWNAGPNRCAGAQINKSECRWLRRVVLLLEMHESTSVRTPSQNLHQVPATTFWLFQFFCFHTVDTVSLHMSTILLLNMQLARRDPQIKSSSRCPAGNISFDITIVPKISQNSFQLENPCAGTR